MLKLTSKAAPTATIRLEVDEAFGIGETEYDVYADLPNGRQELLLSVVIDADGKIAFRTYQVTETKYVSVARNGKLGYEGGARG